VKLAALAAREEVAVKRIVAAMQKLGEQFGLDVSPLEAVQARDPRIRAMKQKEVVADLLEQLVDAGFGPVTAEISESGGHFTLADLEGVPGVGPATLRKIREHLGV
jgi:DNA uptake protein ComE-like DNA-binding protein